jgi:predicted NBD/HSP70 family sugar kinase
VKQVILVNGVPASGKSHVARVISGHLNLPLLALDSIKEPLFDHLGLGDREHNRRLGRASYQAIWSIVQGSPDAVTFVIDAWLGFQPRDVLQKFLANAAVLRPMEIWCHAPSPVIEERFRSRLHHRHAGHPGESYIPELVALVDRANPMDLGSRYDLDTSLPLDQGKLLNWVRGQLGRS